jgi:hypothetical protein
MIRRRGDRAVRRTHPLPPDGDHAAADAGYSPSFSAAIREPSTRDLILPNATSRA